MSEEMVCRKHRLSSFQIIILGFAGVILLGALLLMLPLSTTAGCVGPIETPVASELQPSTGQAPAKNFAPEPTPPQPPKELQPGDEVYIPGFGWVPYEGPNHREYAADMYENGNKIGSMG